MPMGYFTEGNIGKISSVLSIVILDEPKWSLPEFYYCAGKRSWVEYQIGAVRVALFNNRRQETRHTASCLFVL